MVVCTLIAQSQTCNCFSIRWLLLKHLASEFFLPGAELARSYKQGHHFCAFICMAWCMWPCFLYAFICVALFSQSPVPVWAACTLFPKIPHCLIKLCIWGMSPKGRKEVAARVWLHLALFPVSCLVWHQHKFECSPSSECAEWQQRDCHSFTNHLECATSSVLLYPNILGASGEGRGEMLPRTPAACTRPKLLLIGDPVAGAWRLSK